jgi:formylglycine-generating enzyme required for sulfatase activity
MKRQFRIVLWLLSFLLFSQVGCQPAPPKKLTNSTGMKLTYIPPGSFTMGAAPGEPGAKPAEKQHKVTLSKGFYMGIYEVTQDQYLRIMGKNPSIFHGDMLLKNKKIAATLEPGVIGHNHPVDHVTWDDAVEFCKRLSELPEEKKARHVYRLPTEAEWEYACRAGTTTAYNTGDSRFSLDQSGWYGDNAGSQPIDSAEKFREAKGNIKKYALGLMANGNTPHPVGRKKPNAWGLYDMHGNLWEWCSDWSGDYPTEDIIDPKGPSEGKDKVHRGGCYLVESALCRSSTRNSDPPGDTYYYLGFRVVMEVGR